MNDEPQSSFSMETLFALARQATREARLEELRAISMQAASQKKALTERAARAEHLQGMREITKAQLGTALMEQGVSPMLFMGGADPTSAGTAAYVAQAARNPFGKGRL